MAVRSDAWAKCGGFDNDFFAHMEEVDLCWRFHRAGLRVSYVPGSVVYHAGGGVLPYNSELKTYLNFRNNLYLLYKNLPDNKLHGTIFRRRILDGIAALIFLFKGRISNVKAIWKAHRDYRKNLPLLKQKRNSLGDMSVFEDVSLILNKSLVFRFYIKGEKTFRSLNFQNQSE
jgi:GT2 family glycosyltransferase